MTGLSKKQLQILAFPYTDFDALICDGAIRSGKTSIMTVAFFDWAMRSFNGCNFAICGKTVGSAIKNVITPFLAMYDTQKKYGIKFNHSENKLTVLKNGRENIFYIYGGKDESSYTLIQGITLAGVFLDEVALMTRSFVEQAIARCSVDGSKYWFNCNPENPKHWFYTEWILRATEKNALHIHFLMKDNPSLSKKMLERYENLYEGVFYDRYILGQWVRAEGIIFRDISEHEEKYIVQKSELPKSFDWVELGADWGGNGSAHAFTCSAVGDDGVIYVLKSEKKQAKDIAIEELTNAVFDFVSYVESGYNVKIESGNCDHIDVIINTLNEKRYMFGKTYKPPLADRVYLYSMLMASGKLKFVDGECNALIDELKNLVYDPKSEKSIPLDDGSMQIDTYDSFTYSLAGNWDYIQDNMEE